MTVNLTGRFPWCVAVSVERSGGRDPKGNPLPGSTHTVSDCLVTTQSTDEASRADLPDTSAWLYGPAGADFVPGDVVVVPATGLFPHGRFVVNGDVDVGPLGVRVQLRRV